MSEATPGPAGTLLLVDDEPANLDSLERIFAREGYRTLRAESGAAALDLLRGEPVDVRRLVVGRALAAEIAPAEVVNQEQDDVRRGRGGRGESDRER